MASTSAAKQSSGTNESRNWLEMPDEVMANILGRLGTMERLKGPCQVCTSWQRVCKDPAMWKVIVMHKCFDGLEEWDTDYALEELTKLAVDLSCGELIDISFKGFGTDDFLDQILSGSSKLKRLSLIKCLGMTDSGVSRAVKRVPQLEKLHLHYIGIKFKSQDIERIGRNCPQLKSFTMPNRRYPGSANTCDNYAFAIAKNMRALRHLKMSDCDMTNVGLWTILHKCPHLQSLDVCNCINIYLAWNVGNLCMERIQKFKHNSLWGIGIRG